LAGVITLKSEPNYVPLDLRSLAIGSPLVCDLYIKARGRYVLYREASLPFTLADRERLLESGVRNLWVRASIDEDIVLSDRLAIALSLPNEQVPPLAKAGLLYRSAVATIRRALAGSLSGHALAEVDRLVGMTVGYLVRNETAFPALLNVMTHDFSVFTHAMNVAVYALGLGKFIGITDHKALRQLGLGAILHDVGKARVPKEILNKPDGLSAE